MQTIIANKNEEYLAEAVEKFKAASHPVALTGAGISVNSGIADFRSPGGLWSVFSPDDYATLEIFLHNPEKAWQLYREMGKCLVGKRPNKGHRVLAELEQNGLLKGLVTQNVDNLHQVAGNTNVLEIHGDHLHLQCLECGYTVSTTEEHFHMEDIPSCQLCDYPLKPNVVLFGEDVRSMQEIENLIISCDLLLVIGTSANVYPAAGLPNMVKQQGGLIYEFNLEPALSASAYSRSTSIADYFFKGDLSATLPNFGAAVFGRK
jgi:NAD-dependent deacetylase